MPNKRELKILAGCSADLIPFPARCGRPTKRLPSLTGRSRNASGGRRRRVPDAGPRALGARVAGGGSGVGGGGWGGARGGGGGGGGGGFFRNRLPWRFCG